MTQRGSEAPYVDGTRFKFYPNADDVPHATRRCGVEQG